jgi:putative transposase
MRKPRKKEEGACYHVTARSNRGEFILQSRKLKREFLMVLEKAKEKFNFKLKHFCIMSNHIHLMIQPRENTDISKIMQWILSVFAIRFNKIFGYKGHVWYDRFKSKIIHTLNQLIKVFEYISLNPVKAHLSETVFDYSFSALQHIKQNRRDLVDPPDLILFLAFPQIGGNLLPEVQS